MPSSPLMVATMFLVWGIVIHLVCDWFLQNEWMAAYKTSLRHPASWVHAGIHLVGLLLVFPYPFALGLAISHLLIDLRKPLQWWRHFYRQTEEGPVLIHLAFWQDQAAHVLCLALAALLLVHR